VGQLFESIVPFFNNVPVIRAILGFIFVFCLPGFAWTLVFFKRVNIIERVALSLGLSIALVTLSILALDVLMGVRITGANSILIISVLIVVPLAFYYLKRLIRVRSSE